MQVGFIGLGNMGRPMAARIADAGLPLVVYDVQRQACDALIAKGATCAESPGALAATCDVICTSLPGPVEFQSVMFGDKGVGSGVKAGSICLDFTTNSPLVIRDAHRQLAACGAGLVDAPVSGGVEGARKGSLTVLIGGDPASIARIRPVLEAVAGTILHVGDVSTASVCKVLHNCAVFATNLAMMECLTAGVRAGVDAKTLVEVFQRSGLGRNLDLQVAMPATLFRGNFEPRFLMKTAYKDMGLATDLAKSCGVPMRLAEICEEDMAEAMRRGWGAQDNTIYLTLQEERAGAKVRLTDSLDQRKDAAE
jgi:3-hydroxyisobutyrate dehydrogenase